MKLDEVNKDMSKKDEDIQNLTQVIKEIKEDKNQAKVLMDLKEQIKDLN